MTHYIDQAELKRIAKTSHRLKLIEWLKDNGIPFKFTSAGKNRGEVWTTQSQIDASFLKQLDDKQEINFGP